MVTVERHPAHKMIVKQTQILIMVALSRLQLPVAGISDGNANTSVAALLAICLSNDEMSISQNHV